MELDCPDCSWSESDVSPTEVIGFYCPECGAEIDYEISMSTPTAPPDTDAGAPALTADDERLVRWSNVIRADAAVMMLRRIAPDVHDDTAADAIEEAWKHARRAREEMIADLDDDDLDVDLGADGPDEDDAEISGWL